MDQFRKMDKKETQQEQGLMFQRQIEKEEKGDSTKDKEETQEDKHLSNGWRQE